MVIENDLDNLILFQDDCIGVGAVNCGLGYKIIARAENGKEGRYYRFFVGNVVEECIILQVQ